MVLEVKLAAFEDSLIVHRNAPNETTLVPEIANIIRKTLSLQQDKEKHQSYFL